MDTTRCSSRNALAMGEPDLPLTGFGGYLPHHNRRVMTKVLGIKPEKSKGLGMVLSIAVSIAIPMAAPYLAKAIGLSSALAGAIGAAGATVASGIVGAGLGALSTLVTKQKIGQAMLMGGISGAAAGYMQTLKTPAFSANAAAAELGQAQVGIAQLGDTASIVTPVQGASGTEWTVMSGAQAGTVVPASSVGYGGAISTTDLANILSSGGDQAAQVQSLANTLSSASSLAINTPTAMGGNAGLLGTSEYYNPNVGVQTAQAGQASGAAIYPNYNVGAAAPQAGVVQPPAYAQAGIAVTPAAEAAAATQAAATQAAAPAGDKGFFQDTWEALKTKVSDPKARADLVLRAAGQLAGSLSAGTGLSAEQEQLVKEQKAELAYLQQTNRGLFDQRLREATALLGEAKYFDPNYFGLQAQRGMTTSIGRQAQENLRDVSPQKSGLRTAEQRRYNLEAATRGETAYLQGATTAQQNRLNTTQAGLAQLPPSGPNVYGEFGKSYADTLAKAEELRRKSIEDIGTLFGSFTGQAKATT